MTGTSDVQLDELAMVVHLSLYCRDDCTEPVSDRERAVAHDVISSDWFRSQISAAELRGEKTGRETALRESARLARDWADGYVVGPQAVLLNFSAALDARVPVRQS